MPWIMLQRLPENNYSIPLSSSSIQVQHRHGNEELRAFRMGRCFVTYYFLSLVLRNSFRTTPSMSIMKSFIIASGLISLASATAIPKAQKPPGLPVDPNAHPTLIYVDTATEEAKGKRCGTWEVTEGQKNTFWPICTVWLPDPSHQEVLYCHII